MLRTTEDSEGVTPAESLSLNLEQLVPGGGILRKCPAWWGQDESKGESHGKGEVETITLGGWRRDKLTAEY